MLPAIHDAKLAWLYGGVLFRWSFLPWPAMAEAASEGRGGPGHDRECE